MKRQQDTKEIYLCASSFITGAMMGVLISMWPELEIVVRIIFIFYACVFAFMTCAIKTARVTPNTENKAEGEEKEK